ncbi:MULTISPECIES: ribosomal protein S18-alanine N-acetyltransferase [unclassified Enterococcus]|uniref:ribosomal protein S18-alanine N-acetyltransferase n=1 Tax=unclassified Enterococcus TaxID=2608891 RepID=UPI0013EA46FC|nr:MULTISPECIES: ribosomal protein S18-alanine N-acetyltransferase [unclassified Enterococcus]
MIYQKKDFKQEQLAQELWTLSEEAYSYGSPWTKEQFLADIKQPHTEYLLLFEEGTIQGFIGYTRIIDEVEITNIAVSTREQGKGYARHLLRYLLDQEKEKGTFTVFLEVRLSNEVAKHLYESEKFRVLGKRKSYYHDPTEDAVIMCTKLKMETMK